MFRGILKKKFGPSRKEDGLSNGDILYSMFLPNRGMDERDVGTGNG